MHKFYDYEPNWIFNWDTNELINSRLWLPKRSYVVSEWWDESVQPNVWMYIEWMTERTSVSEMEGIKVLFAIFMHDMLPYIWNPPDHLANYLEFIWVDPFENHLHVTLRPIW